MLTRREALTGALAAATTPKSTRIIDCHVHCFDGKTSTRFPYHPKGPYQPEGRSTPEDLLLAMDAAGVAHAVVVHPEPYQDDHRYLEYCLEVGKKRLKGTCLFFADKTDWKTAMPALVKKGGVVALRIHAANAGRLPPFGKPELRALWKAAVDLGMAIQLHMVPRYAPGFEPLIKEFAKAQVIVDHLGRPWQGTPQEHETILGWGKLPNVTIKIASIQPEQDPRRYIDRFVASYGSSRVIFGGGWAADATVEKYKAAQTRLRSFVSHLPPAQQAEILGGNAGKLFRFS